MISVNCHGLWDSSPVEMMATYYRRARECMAYRGRFVLCILLFRASFDGTDRGITPKTTGLSEDLL